MSGDLSERTSSGSVCIPSFICLSLLKISSSLESEVTCLHDNNQWHNVKIVNTGKTLQELTHM